MHRLDGVARVDMVDKAVQATVEVKREPLINLEALDDSSHYFLAKNGILTHLK